MTNAIKEEKKQRLQITLDADATEKYLAWASEQGAAEVDADCEPSGVTINISVSPNIMYASEAYSYTKNELHDFGEAKVELI